MAAVKPINTTSIHRICSGQVILDLATAVKELVENGLDAQARAIEIRFKEYGIQSIEVIDDGTGINQHNFEQLALKHSTSKLSSFEDLMDLNSFGFRGEALSSLCALSKVVILTCTQEEAPAGFKLEFDSLGKLIKKTPIARERGTTVILQDLFEPIPVRHQEFKKNIKREFGKTLTLLQAYAIICKNLKITCSNQLNRSARTVVLSTNGNCSIRDNIANLFGAKTLTQIVPFDFNIQVTPEKQKMSIDSENHSESDTYHIHIVGYISKPMKGYGRGNSDRQFYFINSRPCTLPKVAKTINELYKSFNTNQYPFCVVNFRLEKCHYDVNVTPDKRTIFIHNENKILEELKNEMNSVMEPFRSTLTCLNTESIKLFTKENGPNELNKVNVSCNETKFCENEMNSVMEPFCSTFTCLNTESIKLVTKENGPNELNKANVSYNETKFCENEMKSVLEPFRSTSTCLNTESVRLFTKESGPNELNKVNVSCNETKFCENEANSVFGPSRSNFTCLNTENIKFSTKENGPNELNKVNVSYSETTKFRENEMNNVFGPSNSTSTCLKTEDIKLSTKENGPNEFNKVNVSYNETTKFCEVENSCHTPNSGQRKDLEIPSIIGSGAVISVDNLNFEKGQRDNTDERQILKVTFDISKYDKNKIREQSNKFPKNNFKKCLRDVAGIISSDNEAAERELNRVIKKSDFSSMEIVGQFNLGFIITKLYKDEGCDLLIIDQHASDEKYNFEQLQLHTKINSQRLISPRSLELTAAEELVAIDNIDILKANGFDLEVDLEAQTTKKLKLISQPISNDIIFGVEDLEELIFLLSERPGEMVRCSKVRKMFASRACRKSVMIGDALSRQQMEKIVRHMSEIDQPWNCPHGRPTMRHLFDLSQIQTYPLYSMRQRTNHGK
ncbi:6244_t:CDS:10 [Cetraspora pellucida]|uniref:6244_t:CDS:1 n=1 Tax=Cetraspora pellucida TaxID=1433469 RepID=A0ACA9K4C7_9GLOM|nr:6244_t:CDS:10 [Cetraspora pellucida]